VTDGLRNSFMLGEDLPGQTQRCSLPYANNTTGTCVIPPNLIHAAPGNINWSWQNNESFRSRHPGGLLFAFADGSVSLCRLLPPLLFTNLNRA
jgi:prepilin-type processing-associated H-X9-DG protein